MRLPLTTLALLGTAAAAAAQAPPANGPEFRINVVTAGDQASPAAAGGPGGRFLVAWSSAGQDGSGSAVIARLVGAGAGPLGPEIQVNEYTTADQSNVSVASGPDSFLVTWTSNGQDGSSGGVYGRAFNASGTPLGPEFQVNTSVDGNQDRARVASVPGGYLVVWQSMVGSVYAILGRVYNLAGQPVSPQFGLNALGGSYPDEPIAAGLPDGGYVVAWRSAGRNVHVRRATTSGWVGPEVQADTEPPFFNYSQRDHVAITADAAGNYTVGWRFITGAVGDSIFLFERGFQARRFGASGVPQGPEARVDESLSSLTPHGTLATSPPSRMLAAWTSGPGQLLCHPTPCNPYVTQDGSGDGVYARWYEGASPLGSEFKVNTITSGDQQRPAVAADPGGAVLVAWQSIGQDGSGAGIYAQWYGGITPAALAVDGAPTVGSNGNGVLEPFETAPIAPSWRNGTAFAQAFTGSAVGFTGPAPGLYGIADAVATYPTAAPGDTVGCATVGDCYVVATDGTRPATHWDAFLHEALSAGAGTVWAVHLGDSFADVPRGSPFYRYVETLLHTGVTGGCTGSAYCPTSATDRAQMPVFVLVAREGAGYAPPACGTPVFSDVPASSPFCPWIEELARRGVVAGCGGGNYCPTSPVTREQMAVFLLRTLDPALTPQACTTPLFADVPASSPFCPWIEELARRGIAAGCGGGNYCPTEPVTREQMAAFIATTFSLRLYGP